VPKQIVKPEYESGMKIAYDDTSKRVVVAFRGRINVLPEACATHDEGVAAGERFCRNHGWIPDKAKAVRRPW
jgi:hypothetical protein